MILPLLAAIAVIALRLVLHTIERPVEGTGFMLVHFLALVTVVFFAGARLLRQDRHTPIAMLLRTGFRSAAVYAVAMAVFLYAYFTWYDPSYFQQRIDHLVWRGVSEGQPEAIIRPRMEQFFTPFNYATITLATLLLSGGILTVIAAVFQHKVLRRLRR
ncbi:MAG: DUF4199 family protein [Flavobacteriales bacterium]|jgi:hypothetical protein|nr:DUF4199 family protein [Flavobacteriales bacterium]